MRTSAITLILVGMVWLGAAPAEAQRPGSRGPGGRSEFLKKYDKNKDGKLDEEERKAIRAEFEKRAREFFRSRGGGPSGRRPSGESRSPSAHHGPRHQRGGPSAHRGPGRGLHAFHGPRPSGHGRSAHHGRPSFGGPRRRSGGPPHGSPHGGEMLNRIFDHLDANKDGKIDKAEFRKMAEVHKKFRERIEHHRRDRSGGDRRRGPRASAEDEEAKQVEPTKTA